MMVCHSKKFIFIKPEKVAGSSVESWLRTFCDQNDVFSTFAANTMYDEDKVSNISRNCKGCRPHMTAKEISIKFKDVWHYDKISIIRNPWDTQVSYFWWKHLRKEFKDFDEAKRVFKEFTKEFPLDNGKSYFIDGRMVINKIIRFESLQKDVEALGYGAVKLPLLKTKVRKFRQHYTEYYDFDLVALIANHFGYRYGL